MSKYYLVAKLISWVFPTRNDRVKFRHLCKEIDQRKIISTTHNCYKTILENLKAKYKKEKIKVVFLNDTPAKWQYQSLYEELTNNENFETQIVVTVQKYQTKENMQKFVDYKTDAENCYKFFKDNNMNVVYGYNFETDLPIDLKNFNPDIVFYEQPWGLFKNQGIKEASKYALTCYSSYGSAITSGKNEYGSLFFKLLYKYFIDNDFAQYILTNHAACEDAIVVSGHPKLDNYLRPIREDETYWKHNDKKRIIIAPHFSFYKEAGMHSGTFDRNYKFFLDFAKTHTEYEFIFKPHPRLKEDIIKHNLMTQEECDAYYSEWANLPNTQLVTNGNYIDMFRTSDLLITDCNSFLFEYLPTKNPVIQIINNEFIGHNPFGKKITSGYYSAYENEEIEQYINQLLKENNDPLKEFRINLLNSGIHPKEGYAKFVINYLCNELEAKD